MEAIQEYANITELDAATLNRLIKEIVVHERIDEDKIRHISISVETRPSTQQRRAPLPRHLIEESAPEAPGRPSAGTAEEAVSS